MLWKQGRSGICYIVLCLTVCLTWLSGVSLAKPPVSLVQTVPPEGTDPLYSEFKGVKIGMDVAAVKKKLGSPSSKGEGQNVYSINSNNTVQVFYDKTNVVYGILVSYLRVNDAPEAKSVLGVDVPVKPDGSMFGLIKYPRNGYSVSYVRSAGVDPIVSIGIQRIN